MQTLSEILGLLGGVSVVLTGLFAFLGKTRLEAHKAELQATNARLNKLLESAAHVTKTQFDKEFKIYQEVWAALVELRIKVLNLRPMLDHVDPSKTGEGLGDVVYLSTDFPT